MIFIVVIWWGGVGETLDLNLPKNWKPKNVTLHLYSFMSLSLKDQAKINPVYN